MINTSETIEVMKERFDNILSSRPWNGKAFVFAMADIHAGYKFKLKSQASKTLPVRNKAILFSSEMPDHVMCDELSKYEILPSNRSKGFYMVSAVARIKNVKSGIIVNYQTEIIWDDDNNKPSTYNWAHGNFSCDCNRALFFDGSKCGCSRGSVDGNTYLVNLINPKTGEVFYSEFMEDDD